MLTAIDKKDIGEIIDKSIEKFAIIVARGFQDVYHKLDIMEEKMATKDDLDALGTKLLHRIDRLEDRVRVVETALL
jgi:hypothetical protein